jgi:hypothetical protein
MLPQFFMAQCVGESLSMISPNPRLDIAIQVIEPIARAKENSRRIELALSILHPCVIV